MFAALYIFLEKNNPSIGCNIPSEQQPSSKDVQCLQHMGSFSLALWVLLQHRFWEGGQAKT